VLIGSDVLEFIARKVVSNIRELEGALNRIVAYAVDGRHADQHRAGPGGALERAVQPQARMVTPERIVQAVADYYGVDLDQLRGQKRDRAIVVPRQIAMYLMREETDVSLLRIGAGARRPRPLDGAPRLRQDRPRDAGERGAAPRAGAVREMIYSE
jgi:chromosomal replication initiator protein